MILPNTVFNTLIPLLPLTYPTLDSD